jgi:glycerate-2-kinase
VANIFQHSSPKVGLRRAKRDWRRVRHSLERIYRSAVSAADPARILKARVRSAGKNIIIQTGRGRLTIPLGKRTYLIGVGKGADRAAPVWSRLLGKQLKAGIFIVRDRVIRRRLPCIDFAVAGHPLPDARSLDAARRCKRLLAAAGADDLVIVFLMGGASSLLAEPAADITLADKRTATALLLKSGMAIAEINAVRKHLSAVKGGGLLRAAYPARVVTLAISDVLGNDRSVIGSAPSFHDPTTFKDALRLVRRYRLTRRMPKGVLRRLQMGARREVPETVKPGSDLARKTRYILLADNRTALAAAKRQAEALGFKTKILNASLDGDAGERARELAAEIKRLARKKSRTPLCLLLGGETTVEVTGKGLGGRNQEFALASALALAGSAGVYLLSAASDGSDGPTDAAGAFIDKTTLPRARRLGLNAWAALRRNDSYHFFRRIGGLFRPGPTGTNVLDFVIAIVE